MVRPPTRLVQAVRHSTIRPPTRNASSLAAQPDSSAAEPTASTSNSTLPPQSARHRAQQDAYNHMLEKVELRRAARLTADVFERLGSTQTRDNTFQPHHSLHRPPTPADLTTSHLVAAGAHLGHARQHSHRSALPLVYGTRAGISYIDLRQTLPALRRAAQVVKGVVERDGKVLFVGSLKGTEHAVWVNAKRLGENGYGVTKWLPGTISNAKEVFGWSEIPAGAGATTTTAESVDSNGRSSGGGRDRRSAAPAKLTPLSFKPDLLVLLSPTLNRHALREATQNQVPTIGIIDTDLDPRSVTYAIPANDDSPRAVELIAGVLGMAGKDGLRAKNERVAREAARLASFDRRASRDY